MYLLLQTARTPSPPIMYNKQQYHVDDETIAAQIQERSFKKGTGKR